MSDAWSGGGSDPTAENKAMKTRELAAFHGDGPTLAHVQAEAQYQQLGGVKGAGGVSSGGGADPLIGEWVGGLLISRKLGKGSFGNVYLGERPTDGRHYAIKFLNVLHNENEESIGRFRREAEAISRLKHPSIVEMEEFGWLEGYGHYMVLEHLDGEDLQEWVERTRGMSASATLGTIYSVMEKCCDALRLIHRGGIVHRDLKPANIILVGGEGEELEVKLIDFGMASIEGGERLTRTGDLLGSPYYMSPEQVLGRSHDLDGRSDLYTLGIMLYEMLTGVPPFQGKSAAAVMLQHKKMRPKSLEEACPERRWSPKLERFLQQVLAKRPEDRPADAMTFWSLCEEALLEQDQLLVGRPVRELLKGRRRSFVPWALFQRQGRRLGGGAGRFFLWLVGLGLVGLGLVWMFGLVGGPGASRKPKGRKLVPKGPATVLYHIHSTPKAALFINRMPMGQTPYQGVAAPGELKTIVLRQTGFRPLKYRWLLGEAVEQSKRFRLKKVGGVEPGARSVGVSARKLRHLRRRRRRRARRRRRRRHRRARRMRRRRRRRIRRRIRKRRRRKRARRRRRRRRRSRRRRKRRRRR